MAAAASPADATPGTGGSGRGRGRGRPRGSGSGSKSGGRGRGRGRSRSRSMRWSKPPKRARASSSASSPHSGAGSPHSTSPHAAAAGADLLAARQPLPPGTEVEVRVDDDGFHGSWFEATVLDFTPAKGYRSPARYTVKYVHLLDDDDEGVLAEHFAPSHIRPRPPPPPPPSEMSPDQPRFQAHDIVEAFHNEGWWSGIVVSSSSAAPAAPDADSVTVAFPITREVIDFAPGLVRPRRDYVDGDWIPSRVAMVVRPKRAIRVYEVGDKVEVVRQRDAFGESWFPATIRFVIDDLSYVIEYFDLEEEGEEGPEKATEYLHWKFIRPAVEHCPPESEFQLGPGAAVEAYCDGAWSPGVVRRVIGEGEYEIGIAAKKSEMLVTKVLPLLKPQYKWNGKQWRIAIPKRRANSRRQSVSGKSPTSPVELSSSDEEHTLGKNTLAEGSEHAPVSEMDIPLSALCKSPVSTKSPNSVPMNGHSVPVDNQVILSDMVVTDGELNEPVSGRSVDAHDMLSITQLRKKMASACTNSAVTHTHKIIVRSVRADIKAGKAHPIQELQGKIQSKDIVLALSVSENGRTIRSPDRLVSIGTKRGSSTKVLACKKLSKRRGSKELCSPNSSLDVTGTVQQRGRKEVAEPMEECPLVLGCRKSGTEENITELLNQGLLPMVPPGFKSTDNEKGTNIHDTQFDDEPTGTTNSLIEPKGNGDLCTDHAATILAESHHVMETAVVSPDCPAEQAQGEVNAGSSTLTLRSCSAFESLLPSPQPLSQVSSHHALFVKNSPMWHLIEAMNVFKELPQQPHFLPLQKYPPGLREGYALGLMVAYADSVKFAEEASLDNSMEWFEDKMKTISHLEENGFIVDFMQSAMAELAKLKSERTSYHGEIEKLNLKIVEKTASSSRVAALLEEKDMAAAELERELGRIRQESQRIAEGKEKIDAEATSMKTTVSGFLELCSGVDHKHNEIMSLSKKRKNEIMFALRRKKLS